mgnify:CR=1 FL=1
MVTQAALAAAVGVVAALIGFRYWVYHFHPFPLGGREAGATTPADFGVGYEPITISSGRSVLDAWWVPPPPNRDSGKAVLICHGNRETLSDWAGGVARLHGAGHSALVFDYSGFGASTGRATPRQLRRDARAAFAEMNRRAGAGTELYLLGYSLGTGVLLEGLAQEVPETAGMVLVAPYADLRTLPSRLTSIPRWARRLVPDVHNNLKAIRANRQPTLILHSRDDEAVPLADARALAEAGGEGVVLREVTGWSHGDFFRRPDSAYWDVVLEFLG